MLKEGRSAKMMAQVVSVIIFLTMFLLVIIDKFERHAVTLSCGLATLLFVFGICMKSTDAVLETLNLGSMFKLSFWYHAAASSETSAGINWETIIFVAAMMVMVEGMAHAGFFRWLCMCLAKLVRYKTTPLFLSFMVMSAVLAMFIDSITVILFLAAVTVELSQLLKFDPVPMILAEIFCANLGGSATMCGDPPNIIIGTALDLSFSDFISNTGVMAGISLIFVLIYYYFAFRKELAAGGSGKDGAVSCPAPKEAIKDKKAFICSCVIFALAVILLVTHASTGLSVALIGVIIALLTLITSGKDCLSVIRAVDYKTILFFIGLFMVVGGLEQTGALETVAGFIGDISGGNAMVMTAIIIWLSAVASAFVDNIPFAATMIPIIRTLAATQGVELTTLAWALSMGTDIGGSATPIGASANVVGTSVAAKAGHPVGWGLYCKKAVPATLIVMIISTVYIFIVYF